MRRGEPGWLSIHLKKEQNHQLGSKYPKEHREWVDCRVADSGVL